MCDIGENTIYIKHHGLKIHSFYFIVIIGSQESNKEVWFQVCIKLCGLLQRTIMEVNLGSVTSQESNINEFHIHGFASVEEDTISSAHVPISKSSTSESSPASPSESNSWLSGDSKLSRGSPFNLF